MSSTHSLSGLMKWLEREPWSSAFGEVLVSHLDPACAAAGIELEELAGIIDEHWASILWGCAFEDFLTHELPAEGNVVDDYLRRRGWREGVSAKAYMQGLRASAMSLYEVSDVEPGVSFLARDLVRGGAPVRISERSGTQSLKQWDRVGARVVSLRDKNVIGGGLLPFGHELADELTALLRRLGKRPAKRTVALLREIHQGTEAAELERALAAGQGLRLAAPLISTLWLGDILDKLMNPRLPELRNSEGDELEFIFLRYRLLPGATAARVRKALDRVPGLERDSTSFWNWLGPRASTAKPAKPKADSGLRLMSTMTDGTVVLGTVELKGKTLVLEVNSERRLERGQALLAPALEGLVGAPLTERQTVKQMMANRPAERTKGASSSIPPEDERRIVHASLDAHYREQLDQPVPMLGDITPRQAATTPAGRKKLVAWLKLLENGLSGHRAPDPMASYDAAWLWEELKIADLRR
jgi:hypothetical protein